jgi:hypothetical protein
LHHNRHLELDGGPPACRFLIATGWVACSRENGGAGSKGFIDALPPADDGNIPEAADYVFVGNRQRPVVILPQEELKVLSNRVGDGFAVVVEGDARRGVALAGGVWLKRRCWDAFLTSASTEYDCCEDEKGQEGLVFRMHGVINSPVSMR